MVFYDRPTDFLPGTFLLLLPICPSRQPAIPSEHAAHLSLLSSKLSLPVQCCHGVLNYFSHGPVSSALRLSGGQTVLHFVTSSHFYLWGLSILDSISHNSWAKSPSIPKLYPESHHLEAVQSHFLFLLHFYQ